MTAHNLLLHERSRQEQAKQLRFRELFHIGRPVTVLSVALLAATAVIGSTINTMSYLDSISAALPVPTTHRVTALRSANTQTLALGSSVSSDSAGRVLGASVIAPAPSTEAQISVAAVTSTIASLVNNQLNQYLSQGLLTGPAGPSGASGLTPGFSGANGMVQNGNGQTTSVIGGTPIVSYIPASQGNGNYTGGSLAGFTNLSGQNFTANTENVTGNLTVQGSSSFGSATFSGSASVAGTFSAATSTFSTLTVSGPATFTGSTTIAGLTVTGFNPGLTLGSLAFQGAFGVAQDNANLFYDSINHRLGLGTSTPSQLLTVAGNTLVTGNATTSGNQIISGTLNVAGVSTLATISATNLTLSGPATLQSTLAVTGASTLATTTIINLTVSQAPTISAFNTGILHSNSSGQLSSTAVNLSTGDITGLLGVSNGGIGANTLTQYDLLAGNGTGAIATITPGTTFQILRSAGSGAYPVYSDIGSLLTAGSNIQITGTSTIAVLGSPSFTGTTSVVNLMATGNVGIGTLAPAGAPPSSLAIQGIFYDTESDGGGGASIHPGPFGSGLSGVQFNRTATNEWGGLQWTYNGTWEWSLGTDNTFGSSTYFALQDAEIPTATDILAVGHGAHFLFSNAASTPSTSSRIEIQSLGTESLTSLLDLYSDTTASPTNVMRYFSGPAEHFAVGQSGQIQSASWLHIDNTGHYNGLSTGDARAAVVLGATDTDQAWGLMATTNATLASTTLGIYSWQLGGWVATFGVNGQVTIPNSLLVTGALAAGGSNGLSVSSGGTVGIGPMSSQLATLDIRAPGGTTNANPTGGAGQLLITATDNEAQDVGGAISFGGYKDAGLNLRVFATVEGRKANSTNGDSSGYLAFKTSLYGATLAERMRIDQNGNVGIGTTSPQYLLQVGSASVASGTVARFQNANGTCDINPTTNTLACSSDERLKKDITPMTNDLAKVMDLQPVYFNWNAESAGTPEHPGFIAQQVQQVMPEVVSADPTTGLLSIGYSELIPAVVGAMQEMQAEITTLQGSLTGNATTSDLTVYSPSNFSGDSVGEAEIVAGQTSVRVSFGQAYSQQAIVTFSPEGAAVPAFIQEKDSAGFSLALPSATTTDVTFDWHSFASPQAQLTVSDGTTQPIQLVLTAATPAAFSIVAPVFQTDSGSSPVAQATTSSTAATVIGTSTPATSTPAQTPTSNSTTASSSAVGSAATAAPAVPASSPPTVPPQSSSPDAAANSGDSSGSSGAPSTISAPAPSASPTAAPAQAPADPVAAP